MRVVLDTNVVVSALFSPRGGPAAILQAWREGRIEVVTSPDLLDELTRVLKRPASLKRLGWSASEVEVFLDGMRAQAVLAAPEGKLRIVAADPSDDRVLEAALAGGAGYIVTGDSHLLQLAQYEGIAVLSPARFMALLSLEGS